MFGESESESPRVPSPWDSIIASTSASPSPAPNGFHSRALTPSPLSSELAITLPRLVPESDDGNVEYKLQLLSPSPARFARLVTQLKWRLLEGGGQAYYELGVADSGDLVGLNKEELEQTLETLEMMAGEIGASVIVVKEVEIPAALAKLAKKSGDRRRLKVDGEGEDDSPYSSSTYTETTEGSRDASDDDLSCTVILDRSANASEVFSMDDMEAGTTTTFAVDLEISSVYKPRPLRTRADNPSTHLLVGGKNKRAKKMKFLNDKKTNAQSDPQRKAQNRREARDRKREEKRKALEAMAAQTVEVSAPVPVPAHAAGVSVTEVLDEAANKEEAISTSISPAETAVLRSISTTTAVATDDDSVPNIVVEDDDDDVFGLPSPATSTLLSFPTFPASSTGESHLDVDPAVVQLASATARVTINDVLPKENGDGVNGDEDDDEKPRLIVEALVVRKMSLEEGFLDFGGFAIL